MSVNLLIGQFLSVHFNHCVIFAKILQLIVVILRNSKIFLSEQFCTYASGCK